MLMIPDFRCNYPDRIPNTPCTGYLASDCWDRIRIHVVVVDDGTALPALFVDGAMFYISR